ncbi:MAG: AMP-dependent synthetase/ligase [Bacteroidales bacterium]
MKITHLSQLANELAKELQDKVVFRHRDDSTAQWIPTTFGEFARKVKAVAKSMITMGIEVDEKVAVFSQNKPELLVANMAIYSVRGVHVPLYATSTASQVNYIVNHSEISLLFVGEQQQYDVAYEVLQSSSYLKKLVLFDASIKRKEEDTTSIYLDELVAQGETLSDQEYEKRGSERSVDDIACIMYTSGTTGEPKGVILKHSNFEEAFRVNNKALHTLSDKDRSLAFLPLSHIFEMTWTYFCIWKGIEVYINQRPVEIQSIIKEVRPTLMCSVPRFWEKVYAGVQEKIVNAKGLSKLLFSRSIEIGKEYHGSYISKGKKAPLVLGLRYKFYEKTIFAKLKKVIGIDQGNFFPTSGAPLSDNISEFLHACGINICYGYGLTESTATVSCYPLEVGYNIGSVGKLVDKIECRIDTNGEVLLKGKTIMHGYYKNPEETAKAFTEDGFFRTGDAGKIVNGDLFITDRLKDLFKTANGKYIAPQALETTISEDKFVEIVAIVADKRKFVSALIVPDFAELTKYAQEQGIEFNSREELVSNPAIYSFIKSRIDDKQKQFASFEQVKRFTILSAPFSMDSGELTNTLKIKRRVIYDKYSAQIEAMYSEK